MKQILKYVDFKSPRSPIFLNIRKIPLENFDDVGQSIVTKAALYYYPLLTPQEVATIATRGVVFDFVTAGSDIVNLEILNPH